MSMARTGEEQISGTKLNMIKSRAAYLAARNGARATAPTMRIEAIKCETVDNPARIGLTITKKNGNAVMRNRIKRRMRAAIISVCEDEMRRDHDYVFISRPNALSASFETLLDDARALIEKSHKRLDQKSVRN